MGALSRTLQFLQVGIAGRRGSLPRQSTDGPGQWVGPPGVGAAVGGLPRLPGKALLGPLDRRRCAGRAGSKEGLQVLHWGQAWLAGRRLLLQGQVLSKVCNRPGPALNAAQTNAAAVLRLEWHKSCSRPQNLVRHLRQHAQYKHLDENASEQEGNSAKMHALFTMGRLMISLLTNNARLKAAVLNIALRTPDYCLVLRLALLNHIELRHCHKNCMMTGRIGCAICWVRYAIIFH